MNACLQTPHTNAVASLAALAEAALRSSSISHKEGGKELRFAEIDITSLQIFGNILLQRNRHIGV